LNAVGGIRVSLGDVDVVSKEGRSGKRSATAMMRAADPRAAKNGAVVVRLFPPRFNRNTTLPHAASLQAFSRTRTRVATIPTSMPRSMKNEGAKSLSSYLPSNTRAQLRAQPAGRPWPDATAVMVAVQRR